MAKENCPTPHIGAEYGKIAKTVLMSGDPLRAKFMAENFLDPGYELVNEVRGMYAFTGTYNGKPVTIMGHGMGMPSIGIYTYELFNFYDVETIIRMGSAGAYSETLKIGDVVIAQGACTDSNYMHQYQLPGTYAPIADFGLLRKAVESAEREGVRYMVGNVVSSDIFYGADGNEGALKWKKMGALAVEMEAAALYANAAWAGKKALCVCTISDNPFTGEATTAEMRQLGMVNMMNIIFGML